MTKGTLAILVAKCIVLKVKAEDYRLNQVTGCSYHSISKMAFFVLLNTVNEPYPTHFNEMSEAMRLC